MNNKEKWNKLFSAPEYVYGTDPIDLLKNYWHRLRPGKVLDLAMGEGRNAVFLAEKGFEVTGFDISDIAVDKAKKLAYDRGVKLETKVTDLDMHVFPMFSFDNILISYFKPITRYYSEIHRTLVPGGILLVEAGLEGQHYYNPNELLRHLKDFRILFYNEDMKNNEAMVQCIAQKPTDRDAVKYGFFKGADNEVDKGKFKVAENLFKKK